MSMSRRSAGLIAALAVLPGCMKDMGEGGVSRFLTAEPKLAAEPAPGQQAPAQVQKAVLPKGQSSDIIRALQARPSVLEPGTPYARVADAVIASDARVAEAELRVAQLRAEAAQKNWLPRIGPRISLSSLGDFVAELVLQQVLFDNGRKVAERDLAKANVELAAVTLVEDGNTRVFEALSLYLKAQESRALAQHLAQADGEMAHFEWVMTERVNGGVSDMSDLNVIRQKRASAAARATEAQEAARTAMAELNAMAALPLDGLSGLGGLRGSSGAARETLPTAAPRSARAVKMPRLSCLKTQKLRMKSKMPFAKMRA